MKPFEICGKEKCCGCQACLNICPKGCISMKTDADGALIPDINYDACIECGMCKKVCQGRDESREIEFRKPIACYAAARKNLQNYPRCASGGIGSLIMEHFMKEGTVFATRMDADMHAVVKSIENVKQIGDYSGSRYVLSNVGTAYKEIERKLSEGKVLFIGTPCQVAGLKKYLGSDDKNLITCDLLCHGCSPADYLDHEFKRLGVDKSKITNITFRGFERRENYWLVIWNNSQKIYKKPGRLNAYFKGFLEGYTLRSNCHSCKYTNTDRVGDVTLGDFIGLGENSAGLKKDSCTMVFVNSDKGAKLFQDIKNEMVFVERSINEAVSGGISLREPSYDTEKSKAFRAIYAEKGYEAAVKRIIDPEVRKEKIKRIVQKGKQIFH